MSVACLVLQRRHQLLFTNTTATLQWDVCEERHADLDDAIIDEQAPGLLYEVHHVGAHERETEHHHVHARRRERHLTVHGGVTKVLLGSEDEGNSL